MAVVVNDITPYIQYTAAGGATIFTFPFLAYANTDINVYYTPVNTVPNDITNILTYVTNYTVALNVQPAIGGTVTLNVACNAGDIVTIVRNQPDQRLNNYIDGGPFLASVVNPDFNQIVLMNQQEKMYDTRLSVHYNLSATINPVADVYLPVLPPLSFWRKNQNNTAIEAVQIPSTSGVVVPTVPNTFAYFEDNVGTLKSSIYTVPVAPTQNTTQVLTSNIIGQTSYAQGAVVASVTVSAAQILGMYASPVTILPLSGIGFGYMIHNIFLEYRYATTAFAGGGLIVLQLNPGLHGSGLQIASLTPVDFTDQTDSMVTSLTASTPLEPDIAVSDQALYLSNQTGAFTTGDGSIIVNVLYTIIAMP